MTDRAKRLANLVGWIFLSLFGLAWVWTIFYNNRSWSCVEALCLPIAIGIFLRWQWARILGIGYALFRSVTIIVVMIGLVFSLEDYTGTFSSKVLPQQYVYPSLGMFALLCAFLVYVLFRPDVRELFSKKDLKKGSLTVE
jgi:hypothetical protein